MLMFCVCGRYVDWDGVCAGWHCALRAVEEYLACGIGYGSVLGASRRVLGLT